MGKYSSLVKFVKAKEANEFFESEPFWLCDARTHAYVVLYILIDLNSTFYDEVYNFEVSI